MLKMIKKNILKLTAVLVSLLSSSYIPYKEVEGYVQELGIEHKAIVMSQYRIESGNGTSGLAIKHNNVMGMKLATNRPTTAVGSTESGFAIYDSVRDCIIDYALWQSSYCRGMSRTDYLKYLRRVYTKDNNYLYKLLGV